MFEVLSKHSILSKSMGPQSNGDCFWEAFEAGVRRTGKVGGLLNHLFTGRTEGLAGTISAAALPSYLSGILIGHEIREAAANGDSLSGITIVGNSALCERYR